MTTADRLSRVTFWLAAFDAVICLGFGIIHPLVGDWDSDTDRVIFGLLAGGGGVLLVAGLVAFERSPRVSAFLIATGAVTGALGLFWSLLVPALAIALVVLCVLRVTRLGPANGTGAHLDTEPS